MLTSNTVDVTFPSTFNEQTSLKRAKGAIGALIAALSNIHWRVELHLGRHAEDCRLSELIGEHCVGRRQWLRGEALRLRSCPFRARFIVVQWMMVGCAANCAPWSMLLRSCVSKAF